MYHPVLLPKRNKFGFLKGPNPKLLTTSNERIENVSIPLPIVPPPKRYITSAIKPVSYRLEELKVSYELNKYDNSRRSQMNIKKAETPGGSIWSELEHLEDKQTYVPRRGANVQNLKNQHFLNVISYVKANPENKNNHHHRSQKSSSKCLVCRFLLNSKTIRDKKLEEEMNKPISAKGDRLLSSRFRDSLIFEENPVKPPNSRESNDSEIELIRLREKFSQSHKNSEQPRIKLNLWLA